MKKNHFIMDENNLELLDAQEVLENGKKKIDDVRQKLQNLLIKCDNVDGTDDVRSVEVFEDVKPDALTFLKDIPEELRRNKNKVQSSPKKKPRFRKKNQISVKETTNNEDSEGDIVIEEIVVEQTVGDIVDNFTSLDDEPESQDLLPSSSKKSITSQKNKSKFYDDDKSVPKKRNNSTNSGDNQKKGSKLKDCKQNRGGIPLTYTPESLLLMRLLFLTPIDREYHIMDEAKRLGFLVPSQKSAEYVLNHSLTPLYENPSWMFKCQNVQDLQNFIKKSSKSNSRIDQDLELSVSTLNPQINLTTKTNQSKNSVSEINKHYTNARDSAFQGDANAKSKNQKEKKKRKHDMEMKLKRETFPTQVNKFLRFYEPDANIAKLIDFPDFNEPESQYVIKKYAQMLVEKNIGYIVEGKKFEIIIINCFFKSRLYL